MYAICVASHVQSNGVLKIMEWKMNVSSVTM